jgi:hypothetical protein
MWEIVRNVIRFLNLLKRREKGGEKREALEKIIKVDQEKKKRGSENNKRYDNKKGHEQHTKGTWKNQRA